MIRFIKNIVKRLPGIRDLVAQRDQLFADLGRERTEWRRERDSLISAEKQLARERDRVAEERDRLAEDAAAAAARVAEVEQNARRHRTRKTMLSEALKSTKAKLTDERGRSAKARAQVESSRETIAELRQAVESERSAKQELRERIRTRAWTPGYALQPEYEEARRRFAEHCIGRGRLRPDGKVLDVGCGIGGVAEALAGYLEGAGSYEGLDVLDRAVATAQASVGDLYPNFHFHVADVYNNKYNPTGSFQPEEYVFPYPDDTFDLTILRSVFTHMLPPEVENYVGEIARTLKPGGRCLITYFLLNDESRALLDTGGTRQPFQHGEGVYRLSDPDIPEAAVALDEEWVLSLYAAAGLEIVEPTIYGSWRYPGVEKPDGQDLITAQKKG